MTKHPLRVMGAATLGIALLTSSLAAASPANAAVWDCHALVRNNYGDAWCNQTTGGQWRVRVTCYSSSGYRSYTWGPWMYKKGWISRASCGSGWAGAATYEVVG